MTLFDWAPAPASEGPRLGRQIAAVHRLMSDGEWWTFDRLRAHIGLGISEAGLSARIRDLRKPPLNLTVERRKTEHTGIFAYRIAK